MYFRDRIRDQLKPEVTNSRNSFISIYGDPGKFKDRVDKVHDQTLDIRDKVTTVKEIHGQLQLHLSDIAKISNSIQDEFPEFKDTLASYNGWAKAIAVKWKISVIALEVDILIAISSTSAAAVSLCMLASAGIGALAVVGLAAADIVSSVKEEKQLRDHLRDTESKYLKAKADLESAFSNIKAFQRMFCSNIIAYYRDLSVKGRTYDKTFEALYSYIIKWYGDSNADCETKYGNSNLETLTELSDNVLQPLLNFLSKDIEKLRTKIVEVKETNLYLSEIKKMVQSDKKSPIAIFRAITASKPKFMGKVFTTLWDLLHFVAIEVLPTTECYEGYNLGRIRAGSMTKDNYNEHPVCHSGDIQADVTKIRQEVSKGFAPCKIFRQVETAAFRSQYSVIKYIADHILKTSSCYWGYDLKFIRNDDSNVHDLREIDTALINSVLFQTLAYFPKNSVISNDQISTTRHVLCTSYHVCSTTWQTFILCQTWSGHDVTKLLGCTNTGNTDTSVVCVPGTQQFEMCKVDNSFDPHLPYIR